MDKSSMNQMDEISVMGKSGEIEQNVAGTCQQIDTDLTRDRSRDVRAGLHAMRRQVGYDSAAGHRCSNIDEMLLNRETATSDHRKRLDAGIAVQAAELAALVSKGDRT